jgi:hypothetical protein
MTRMLVILCWLLGLMAQTAMPRIAEHRPGAGYVSVESATADVTIAPARRVGERWSVTVTLAPPTAGVAAEGPAPWRTLGLPAIVVPVRVPVTTRLLPARAPPSSALA